MNTDIGIPNVSSFTVTVLHDKLELNDDRNGFNYFEESRGMWNHAQNCTPGGDEDTNEQDRGLLQKERVEKSLDLTQYLKYLDQLFGQGTRYD